MDEGDEEYSGFSCLQRKCGQAMGSSPVKLSLFDLRVFYVRLSCSSSPHYLTLRLSPKNAETTSLEVSGERISFSENKFFSVCLGKTRVDKDCEEAFFVSTEIVRTTGTLQFQVCDKENVLICGSLGFLEAFKRGLCMDCCSAVVPANCGYLRGKRSLVMTKVYVAGNFSGYPVILTKIVQLIAPRKTELRATLEANPESTTEEVLNNNFRNEQLPEDTDYAELHEKDEESLSSFYSSGRYVVGDEDELSLFNAGVRVGVGIGLGMCLGIGIGIGLLVHTYQATVKNFRKRLS